MDKTEKFIEKAKNIHGNKYDYSKVVYKGCDVKVIIICPIHGEFEQTPSKHINSKHGCPKCGGSLKLSTEEFIKRAKEIHRDKYDYSKVNYVNNSTKVCVICKEHGEFWQMPNKHLIGRGCPKCGGTKKLTKEEFIKRAIEIHGNKYDYSKVEYKNIDEKVCIICPDHGEFFQTPSKHLNGRGCQKCGGSVKLSTEEFIKRAKEVHGNNYDYSKVEYVNNNTKVCIICPDHGEFWQIPINHLQGKGCRICGNLYKNMTNKKTTAEFIEEARKIHGDKYDYSKVEYVNCETKVCIICPKHGEFWQTPYKHTKVKHGCPFCSSSKMEISIKTLLQNNKIEFEEQKRFDWLGKQSLDFYLPQYNLAIECQGIQHFEPIEYFGGVKTLENQIKRDKRKYLLCENNSIEILYYSTLKKYCEINTLEKLIEEILKHGKVHCTTE